MERNYSTLTSVDLDISIVKESPRVSMKEGGKVEDSLCPSIIEEVRKMINCLKNRKERMQMEMEIIRETLGKVWKIPKPLSNIICTFTWDISRLSHENVEVCFFACDFLAQTLY